MRMVAASSFQRVCLVVVVLLYGFASGFCLQESQQHSLPPPCYGAGRVNDEHACVPTLPARRSIKRAAPPYGGSPFLSFGLAMSLVADTGCLLFLLLLLLLLLRSSVFSCRLSLCGCPGVVIMVWAGYGRSFFLENTLLWNLATVSFLSLALFGLVGFFFF
ncbi:unnamed protein product [Ectocarpus sp. 12 AP-2014]